VSVDTAWDRIEAWLKAHARDVRKSLRPPAKPPAVHKVEATIGVRLPPDFVASVGRHNGQSDEAESGLFPHTDDVFGPEPAWRLLPLSEIAAVWGQLKGLYDAGEYAGQATDPSPGVRADRWCPGWVPVADNGGGDHLCLDTTPGEGGRVGQIVVFRHDSPSRPLLAGSFEELLTRLADGVESGRYIFEADEGLVEATDGASGVHGSEQPITDRFLHQVILLPVERPTADQLRVVQEFSQRQYANLLEVRRMMIAGGFSAFGELIGNGLARVVASLEQAGIPHRVEALPRS
jgi:cell wall assembly regulator SMI1